MPKYRLTLETRYYNVFEVEAENYTMAVQTAQENGTLVDSYPSDGEDFEIVSFEELR